jgi:hypothetical protein
MIEQSPAVFLRLDTSLYMRPVEIDTALRLHRVTDATFQCTTYTQVPFWQSSGAQHWAELVQAPHAPLTQAWPLQSRQVWQPPPCPLPPSPPSPLDPPSVPGHTPHCPLLQQLPFAQLALMEQVGAGGGGALWQGVHPPLSQQKPGAHPPASAPGWISARTIGCASSRRLTLRARISRASCGRTTSRRPNRLLRVVPLLAEGQGVLSSRIIVGASYEHATADGAHVEIAPWFMWTNFRARQNFAGDLESAQIDPRLSGLGDLFETRNLDASPELSPVVSYGEGFRSLSADRLADRSSPFSRVRPVEAGVRAHRPWARYDDARPLRDLVANELVFEAQSGGA